MKLAPEPTVTVPLSVKFPVVAVAVRAPPTADVPRSSAVALTTVALPVAPVVLSVTVPVTARVPRSISALV